MKTSQNVLKIHIGGFKGAKGAMPPRCQKSIVIMTRYNAVLTTLHTIVKTVIRT